MILQHKTIFRAFLFLCCLCSLTVLAQGQPSDSTNSSVKNKTVTIIGKVTDKVSGNPIEFAIVRLLATTDSSLVSGIVTDSSGIFALKAKKNGEFNLLITLIDYSAKKIPIKIREETNNIVDLGEIKVEKSGTTLDEVQVVGNYSFKIDIDKKIYKIDTSAISSNGTAGDVLQNIPSVFVTQDGSVTLRGGKVQLYINGKPSGIFGISKSQVLDYIPASLIESVEVISDPSAKYDADGGNGIINIVLKNTKKRGLYGMIILGAGTGDKYNGSVNITYGFKKLSVFISYDARNTNMYSWETKNRESNLGNIVKYVNQDRNFFSKTFSQNARAKIQYDFNKMNSLSFSYLHSKILDKDISKFHYSHLDSSKKITKLYDRKIEEIDTDYSDNYSLNYTKKFKKSQQVLTADVFYSKGGGNTTGDILQEFYNTDYTPSGILPLKSNSYYTNLEDNIVGQIDYVQPLSKKIRLEMGVKTRIKTTDVDYKLENFNYADNSYTTDTAITNHFNYNLKINAGYLTYRHKYKSFSYKIGVRVEQSIVNLSIGNTHQNAAMNYINVFPSSHLLKELKKNNKLTLRYSKRIDRPALSELSPLQQYNDPLFLNKGNPYLLPEYTHSFEFSHIKSWKNNSVTSSAYYQSATGTIQRVIRLGTDGVTTTNYQNLNSSQKMGAEVNFYIQLFKWWRINSNLNGYRRIMDGTNVSSDYISDNYSWSAKINTNFTLWKKSILQFTANYQSPTYSPSIVSYSQFFADASFRQDFFKKRLSVSLRCTDIFHTQRKIYQITGSNYNIYSDARRQSRVFFIGVTFRPFGYNKKLNDPEDEQEIENAE